MTNEDLYLRARRIVAGRRQKVVTLSQEKRLEINKCLPQLFDLESKKNLAGINIARLAVASASEEEIAKATNDARQLDHQIEQLLQSAGYTLKDLQPEYTCALCHDTGRKNGLTCDCVNELVRQMRQEQINETSPLYLCNFNTFDLNKYPDTMIAGIGTSARGQMAQILAYCKAYSQNFSLLNNSLYLCGYAGLGKTHLALSVANEVLQKGFNVVYVSAQDAFDKIEKERFDTYSNTLRTLELADLLILDDLGTEFISPYISSCLYGLINARCNTRRPTIYTSNIVNDADLRRRYTEKIVSRLLGSCDVLTFCGDDIRLQGK